MLHYAAVFFVIAIIAAVFGFTGLAVGAASIAKILFFVFLIGALRDAADGRLPQERSMNAVKTPLSKPRAFRAFCATSRQSTGEKPHARFRERRRGTGEEGRRRSGRRSRHRSQQGCRCDLRARVRPSRAAPIPCAARRAPVHDAADEYVRGYPWAAVGVAIGIGLLLGFSSRR